MNLHLMAGCSDKLVNERMRRGTNDKFWSVLHLLARPSSAWTPSHAAERNLGGAEEDGRQWNTISEWATTWTRLERRIEFFHRPCSQVKAAKQSLTLLHPWYPWRYICASILCASVPESWGQPCCSGLLTPIHCSTDDSIGYSDENRNSEPKTDDQTCSYTFHMLMSKVRNTNCAGLNV